MKILITQRTMKTEMKNLKDQTGRKRETDSSQENSTRTMKIRQTRKTQIQKITFPSKRDMEKQYFQPTPNLTQEKKMETDIEIKEEVEETLPDEEPIRREEGQDDVWITNKIRKNVKNAF
jgi:hypothetical protein